MAAPDRPPALHSCRACFVWFSLFLLFVGFYGATSAGHVTSGEEDRTYYRLEGLVERGNVALVQPDALKLGVVSPADGGDSPPLEQPRDSLLHVLLAVPFYLLGKAVALAFPPDYAAAIGRFSVTGLSAVATAAAAVALGAIVHALGGSLRAGVGLALIYGIGTIAWTYARSFWSVPLEALFITLATLLAARSRGANPAKYWLGVGAAIGALAAVQSTSLVLLPIFGLYLFLVGLRARRELGSLAWMLRAAAGLGGGLLLIGMLAYAANLAVFEHPLEQTPDDARSPMQWMIDWPHSDDVSVGLAGLHSGDLSVGLPGLLFSPGKGLLLYSPIILAGLLALPQFARRNREEGVLACAAIGALLLIHAASPSWPGDSSWGPRHLVGVIPLALLPLSTWLDLALAAVWRWLILGLIGLSVGVQALGVLVPFQAYVAATDYPEGGRLRLWHWPDSPILGHARILLERAYQYGPLPMPSPPHPVQGAAGEFVLGPGMWNSLRNDAAYPRWTAGRATIPFANATDAPAALWLEFEQPKGQVTNALPQISLQVDGAWLDSTRWWLHSEGEHHTLLAPLGELRPGHHRLELTSPPLPAAELLSPSSSDELGILVHDLALYQDGRPFAFKHEPSILPLPVSVEQPWGRRAYGWFNDGRLPHLLDLWPWYVFHSGLPAWLAAGVVLPIGMAVLGTAGLSQSLGRRTDVRNIAAVAMVSVAAFAGVLAIAAAVPPTAARPFPVGEPLAPPGTWRLHPYEARPFLVPGREAVRARLEYLDTDAPPVAVHYRPGRGRGWHYSSWLLHRDGSWTWRSLDLLVPASDVDGRELSFTSSSPAVFRPIALGTAALETGAEPTVRLQELIPGSYALREGFYESERPSAPLPRWTDGRGVIELYPSRTGRLAISLELVQPDFGTPRPMPDLAVRLDEQPVSTDDWQVSQPVPGRYLVQIAAELGADRERPFRLELLSPTFVPAEHEPGNADRRVLGVQLEGLSISAAGEPLTLFPGVQLASSASYP